MEVFRSEIRSGILILVSAAILAVGIFMVSDLKDMWREKRELVIIFQYADGISKGSPVWYAGLEVGEVKRVDIATHRPDRIAVTVSIDPRAKVKRDSRASIRSLGMMGAKYVEISPGSEEAPELPQGEVLHGETPVSLSEVIETGHRIAVRLEETIREVHGLIEEIKSQGGITQTLRTTTALVEELRDRNRDLERIFKKVEGLIASSQGSLEGLSRSLEGVARRLEATLGQGGAELVALLSEMRQTNESLKEGWNGLRDKLSELLSSAHEGTQEATALVRDARNFLDANDQNIQILFVNLMEASKHLEALSEDLRAHPWKVIWKEDGDMTPRGKAQGPEEWRSKGRVGRIGKE